MAMQRITMATCMVACLFVANMVSAALVAKFDGTDLSTTDGLADSWNNQGVGGDATATGDARPAAISVTMPNGTMHTVVDFDGSDDVLEMQSDPTNFDTNAFTWFAVCRSETLAPDKNYVFQSGYSAGAASYTEVMWGTYESGVNDAMYAMGRAADGGLRQRWQFGVGTDNWTIISATWDGSYLRTWFYNENAGEWYYAGQTTSAADANPSGHLRTRIGANSENAVGQYLDGQIAEIRIYNEAMMDTGDVTRLAIENELMDKYLRCDSFGTAVSQVSKTVPRLGRQDLLMVDVCNPTANASALDEITVTLKNGSVSNVSRISIYDNSVYTPVWLPKPNELAAIDDPSSETVTFTLNQPLAMGINHFSVAIEPSRAAAIGSTIDAQVDQFVFSGEHAGTLVPGDGDPAGELTLALMPMSVDICNSTYGEAALYRIPGIVCDGDGVLHAVFNSRYDDTDLPGDMDVDYTRSTDGGSTWDAHKSILDFDASVPGSLGNGVSDPCILWDPVTDTLWVAGLWSFGDNGWTGSGPGTATNETVQYVLTKSVDGGDSWSAPINITEDVKANPDWDFFANAPGHGLVMRDGTLVFPSQRRDGTIANDGINQMTVCFVYSSDHGATWHFGSALPDTTPQNNENTVCELDSGNLLFSCRNVPGLRGWAEYTPGGAEPMRDGSWGPYSQQLPDPKCQASVFQWKSTFNGHPKEWILFANPSHSSWRYYMTLQLSADGGATWPVSRLVDAGRSAYSSLCTLPDGSIGLLYEKGVDYQSITFVRVEEAWLLNSEVDSDGDGMPDGWEKIWGTNPDADDASANPDGDGLINSDEYITGSDPYATSSFSGAIRATSPDSVSIEWNSAAARVYDILWSPSLTTGSFSVIEAGLHYPTDSYTDHMHGTNTMGFYRLNVRQP